METWELVARERIRDTLVRYHWAGDAFRLDELAAVFCDDGVLEIRGEVRLEGRSAIVDFLGGGVQGSTDDERREARRSAVATPDAPRIVRHALTNTRFVEIRPEEARVESYFTVFTDAGLDHFGRYRDTLVPVGDDWRIRHRFVSVDWQAVG